MLALLHTQSVNIGGSAHDPSYRYKMPKLIAVVEGRGNGIRTRVANLPEVAKALKVRADYPLKYFGYELGAQSQWNAKELACIVNGAHQANDLQRLLDGFIAKFVLCPKCQLPETDLEVKRGLVYANCSACGFNGALTTKHKLTSYIVKNPPAPKKKKGAAAASSAGEGAAAAGTKKVKKSVMDTSSGQNAGAAAHADDEDDPFAVRIDVHKAQVADDDDAVQWSVDTSASAVAARQKEQIGGNRVLSDLAVAAVARDIGTTAEEFEAWYVAEPRDWATVCAQLLDMQTLHGHTNSEMLSIFCETCWDASTLAKIEAQRPIYEQYCSDPKCQKIILGYVERLLGVKHPELVKFAAHYLKALYEADAVEEEAILTWADKGGASKYVKKDVARAVKEKAKQFVDWLRENADDEDDDEDEGDGEAADGDESDEADVSAPSGSAASSAPSSAPVSPPASPSPKTACAAAADDDVDVDNI